MTKPVTDQQILGELSDALSENFLREMQEEKDPFESYGYLLKMRLYEDENIFRARFIQGYSKLLETLEISSS